jgi:hypothetical protein
VLPADTLLEAEAQAALLNGNDLVHFWDGSGTASTQFAGALSLTGPGWDVYLLYRKGMRWTGRQPPVPTFWMHQLPPNVGADPALYLRHDPARLATVLGELTTM